MLDPLDVWKTLIIAFILFYLVTIYLSSSFWEKEGIYLHFCTVLTTCIIKNSFVPCCPFNVYNGLFFVLCLTYTSSVHCSRSISNNIDLLTYLKTNKYNVTQCHVAINTKLLERNSLLLKSPERLQLYPEHFQTKTENESLPVTTNFIRRRCGVYDFGAKTQVSTLIYLLTNNVETTDSDL